MNEALSIVADRKQGNQREKHNKGTKKNGVN